ncbi:hypothetical protein GCM10027343_42380 [Noviherbaspirillum agri]
MDIDAEMRRRGEFPVDQPLEALKTDHGFVRQLFEQHFQSQEANNKKELGAHLLALLETHTALEERAFYPRVREVDPSLMDHCEQEHGEARQMIDNLKLMDEGDPHIDALYRRLSDSVLKHVEFEEQQLFPKVEQAGLDMTALGQEMQAVEIQMIAARNQRPVAPGVPGVRL